jgi:cytochrome c oxidase subunit 4
MSSESHAGKAPSERALTLTFIALLVLAAVSFGLSFLSLGVFTIPAALAISAVKATLVVMIFMELVASRASARIAIVASLLLFATLLSLTLLDHATRATPPMLPP